MLENRNSLSAGFCFTVLKMGHRLEEDKMKPRGGLKCCKLGIIFLLLTIISFVGPVSGFALKTCRISQNNAICVKSKLKAVPRDIPSTVTVFDLSENRISRIQAADFRDLPVLIRLDLNRNNISQIDSGAFANLISLQKLNLNNNRLVKLGENVFKGLSGLTELRILSNRMKEVASTSFKPLTSLQVLDISHNKLDSLEKVHLILQHLPHLGELVMKDNNLFAFRSWELTNRSLDLRAIDLSQNPIAVFTITEDIFPNLTRFNIGGSSRKQQMIWDVHNHTFLSRVSTLDISGLQMALGDMKTLLQRVNSSLTSLRMNAMKYNLAKLINMSCTIPTLSSLQLRYNKLKIVSSDLFKLCVNVTELDLTKSNIKAIDDNAFKSLRSLKILTLSSNRLPSVPAATRNLPALLELDLSNNNISSLQCHDFADQTKLRQLNLYRNSIPDLKDCLFKDLTQLQVLKLQSSHIRKLNGAFKRYLPNLTQLNLYGNELTAIKGGVFKSLRSLQNLSLHQNKITTLEKDSFVGLTNLTRIQLQSNNINKQQLDKDVFNTLINLRRLDLENNNIKYESSFALLNPPFSKLSRLEELSIPAQHYRNKHLLPRNFLQGLTNLLLFKVRNNQLVYLHKDTFSYTPKLQTLDISSNDLTDLPPELFFPIQNLKSLYISRASLHSLDIFIGANLTNLEFLQARNNLFSVIRKETIESLPALVYLDLQSNSFTCDCDNAWFLQWVKNDSRTQVFDAYNYTCNYPPVVEGTKLLDLDIRDCVVDTGFICFISTTCTILCFMMATFTYHFMRWQLVYAYYLFMAWLLDTKHKNKQAPHQYDAFISYNTHDEPWVIRELLPKLEGEQGWKLCLHHRDFEPGKPIIDNITDAIYGSRKTICVISRRYLDSEWCSKEIQAASFRLFDEQKDVLILVFLEEIPRYLLSPYHRMRKLLKRQTYLSWPQAGEHAEVFWQKLRQALKTKEDPDEDRFHLTLLETP
ncbi:toll-like receptor 13 [Amphiprion ocellaris]|uniref:TIR domain-containing protein n=1 Tax=Amphiprion ocellaris TaxID=80972 RepID=A0A3Q1BTN8_AMPOC|nr:toll-like receptor 13 [Amphiprion ocellaris]